MVTFAYNRVIANADNIFEAMKIKTLIVFVTLLQISCKKHDVNIPENDSWKPVSELKYGEKNASYCYSNGDILLIRSLSSVSFFDKSHRFSKTYINNNSPLYRNRPFPITNDYLITVYGEHGYIEFNPITDMSDIEAFKLHSDSNFIKLDLLFAKDWTPAYINSPSGYYVFKIQDKSNINNSTLAILNIKNTSFITKVKLNDIPANTVLNLYDNGRFYFSIGNQGLFSMDSIGNYEKVGNRDFTVLRKVNGIMFGMLNNYLLTISYDNGKTWFDSNLSLPTPFLIGLNNKLFYHIDDYFGEIRLENQAINIVRYNSKGLEGNEITCICKHNDRYYCTTKTGVFYIEEKYFKPI